MNYGTNDHVAVPEDVNVATMAASRGFSGQSRFTARSGAITFAKHAAIVELELNPERRDFYELLWHTGASQSDAACLVAEDVDWASHTISYSKKKLKSRGGIAIKPALIRFGEDVAVILKRRPAVGPLFPYLQTVRAGDRATEFKQRCVGWGSRAFRSTRIDILGGNGR